MVLRLALSYCRIVCDGINRERRVNAKRQSVNARSGTHDVNEAPMGTHASRANSRHHGTDSDHAEVSPKRKLDEKMTEESPIQ